MRQSIRDWLPSCHPFWLQPQCPWVLFHISHMEIISRRRRENTGHVTENFLHNPCPGTSLLWFGLRTSHLLPCLVSGRRQQHFGYIYSAWRILLYNLEKMDRAEPFSLTHTNKNFRSPGKARVRGTHCRQVKSRTSSYNYWLPEAVVMAANMYVFKI